MSECKCSMRTKILGDGCRYCNPQYLIEHLTDERDEQAQEIEQLQQQVVKLRKDRKRLRLGLLEVNAMTTDKAVRSVVHRILGDVDIYVLAENKTN